jgi:7-cyano-7-deazaguanine synthase
MCTISGCVSYKSNPNWNAINEVMKDIIKKGAKRGRDSYGTATFGVTGHPFENKRIGPPAEELSALNVFNKGSKLVLVNNRAEPTTEYVKNKTFEDVQPFNHQGIWITHNGIIANDQELRHKFSLKGRTKVDSAVLPELLHACEWQGDAEGLLTILKREVVGSYALAIYKEGSSQIFLATNYKPLSISYNELLDCLFFSSLEDFITESSVSHIFITPSKTIEVKPYTLLEIALNYHEITEHSLRRYRANKKALVIASSGLDSTVAACWASFKGYQVELLHFNYGCRATAREAVAIKKIAEYLNVPLTTVPVDVFKNVIKHSRLTNTEEGDLVKDRHGEASAELAWEWVPARNLIFMSIAAGYAEANSFEYIILGGNLEESGSYPDNELIFQRKFDQVLPYALNLNHHVKVLTPVADLMKHEIVKLGLELHAPLHLTWSCYENRDTPCQTCGPDYMRRMAFRMNGFIDNQATDPTSEFWAGCREVDY